MDNRISKKNYWDNIYNGLKDPRFHISLSSYWNKIFFLLLEKYLTKDSNKKMVEIGGAPGTYAVLFNKIFQYNSYSIDYSEKGNQKTIENFKKNMIPEKNVITMDFLDKNKLMNYQYYFDVVFSAGFIEHFKNPSEILNLHLEILKNEGYVIIMIPVNNFIVKLQPFFKKEVIEQHNVSFMNINEFSKIFISNERIEVKYLDYLGGINLAVVCYNNFFIRKFMYALQLFIQTIGLESLIPLNKYTSPYLICIAQKIF
jgi:SAM-dependent methyltransferase